VPDPEKRSVVTLNGQIIRNVADSVKRFDGFEGSDYDFETEIRFEPEPSVLSSVIVGGEFSNKIDVISLQAVSQINYSFVITAPNLAAANAFLSTQPDVFANGRYFISSIINTEQVASNIRVTFSDAISQSRFQAFCDGAICGDSQTSDFTFDGNISGTFRNTVGYSRLNDLQFTGRLGLQSVVLAVNETFFDGSDLEGEVGTDFFVVNAYRGFIDPVISIDAAFLEQNPGFEITQIAVSDVAGAVPEPASWAMMIAGFGIAGAALRRRRMRVAVS
jgi:PEP-CTERM motif